MVLKKRNAYLIWSLTNAFYHLQIEGAFMGLTTLEFSIYFCYLRLSIGTDAGKTSEIVAVLAISEHMSAFWDGNINAFKIMFWSPGLNDKLIIHGTAKYC